ncbi:5-oxoprolinase subunit PxpA [Kamptonema cortianum]|nr:5-oxoprolinase subunit PxpA [Geitlerinema splendidum]MDK3155246.1 5-oxoprolinase subunit PxpA [Kamptonema cortianum]
MKKIDLNVDVGEGAGFDEELLTYATSANICCGAHAGSAEHAIEIARMARANGVRVGAHPGYPDREFMGRRYWDDLPDEIRDGILGNLIGQVNVLKGRIHYIKPHGALYNEAAHAGEIAILLSAVVARFSLPLLGLEASYHKTIAETVGVPLIKEGFADRRYTPEGLLVPRSQPGAMISDLTEVRQQVLELAGRVDSICVHGDGPEAVQILACAKDSLLSAGYEVGA